MAHELGISILTFRNFRIPRSAQTYHPLAYGAIAVQGEVYFSVNPFGVHILGLAIEQAVAKVPNAPTLIYHKDHHLVPIWWLQINIPRQQPFLKRVRNQILRLVKNQGRIA